MPKTIDTIRTELMAEFGLSESNSNDGTNSARVLDYMNTGHDTFINRRNWTFNNQLYSINLLSDTTVQTDFLANATSIVFADTSTWALTGKVNVNNNLISFTGNNLTDTLTVTTSEISRDHLSGEKTSLLYLMPEDYAKPAEVEILNLPYLPEDVRNSFEVSTYRFWQHHFVDTSGNYRVYLQFPYSQTERTVYIKYSKRPVDLNDVDTSTYYLSVPNPHYEEYIKYYTMARMYRHLMKREMATDYEIMAKATLKEAAAYDSRQHASNKVPIRTKWDNPSQLLYKNSPRTRS